jgi:hypothetical protein
MREANGSAESKEPHLFSLPVPSQGILTPLSVAYQHVRRSQILHNFFSSAICPA